MVLDITTGNAGNGERVFIAGGGGFNSAAAWNIGGGERIWRQRADGDVQAVRFANNNVYFGFHDGFLGNTRCGSWPPTPPPVTRSSPASRPRRRRQHRRDGHRHRQRPYLVSAGKFPRMGGVAVRGVSVHDGP